MTRYDFGYLLVSFFSLPLWPRYLIHRRYRNLIRTRLFPKQRTCDKPSIWLHAVSVGEVNSLLALLEDLSVRYAGHQLLLTVSTPSGYRHALEKARGCIVLAAPFDFSFSIRRFIAIYRPSLVVLNELEIWPNWLTICHKEGIPQLLINARLSDRAFSRYLFFRRFSRFMLDQIDRILCQSDHHRERFLQLGIRCEKVITSGHIKADEARRQVSALADLRILEKELGIGSGKKRLLFASSHIEDEMQFLPVLDTLRQDFQIIIAPRHLDRLKTLSDTLNQSRIPHRFWSTGPSDNEQREIILFDRMGKLIQLIALSELVVMGGTFSAKTGGHNLFEPLACQRNILGGPHTENFPDIAQDLRREGLYHTFHNSTELLHQIDKNKDFNQEAADRAAALLDRYCGANIAILREIQNCLPL